MTKPSPERRHITLNLRTTPTIKSMVERLSVAERRSIAQTIEILIEDECKRRGIAVEPARTKPGKKKTP